LGTVRAFSRERLDQVGETDAAIGRQLVFYAEWAESVEETMRGSTEIDTYDRADQELDNLRSALDWGVQRGNHNGHWLVGNLANYWPWRRAVEGLSWSERLIHSIPSGEWKLEAKLCGVSASCAFATGNLQLALKRSEQALAAAQHTDDLWTVMPALSIRGLAFLMVPDPVQAEHFLTRGRDLAVAAGRIEWTAHIQQCLALNAELAGDLQAALAYCREGLSLFAGKDVATTAYATLLIYAASCMHRTGSPTPEVMPVLKEAVEYVSRTRSPMLLAAALDRVSEITAKSQPRAAARLLRASDTVKQKYGVARETWAETQELRGEIDAGAGPLEPPEDISLDDAIEMARAIVT
jgi:non-specific serine/threonine protein kinase